MKFKSLLLSSAFLYRLVSVSATSSVTFYSDTQCSNAVGVEDGPDDGTCTQFTEGLVFGSFKVTSLDKTCAVTVYGEDPPYCSSDTKFLADFSNCMTNTTVNQFSVDCQDASAATSSPTATAVPSGSNSGLSGRAKAGIAVASVVVGLGLITLLVTLVVRDNRRKRRPMTPKALEADSNPVAPPYSAELAPDEKKPAVELPPDANVPVEAPGDEHWPPPQELEGDIARSEMEGSTPAQEKSGLDVKDVKLDPDAKN